MMQPVEYGEVLRTLGRLLDAEQAQDVEILARDHAFVLSWRSPQGDSEGRSYRPVDITELQMRTQQMQEGLLPCPGRIRTELLATLGQNLDEQGVELQRLLELRRGYWVHVTSMGIAESQWYPLEDLQAQSEQYQARRTAELRAESILARLRDRTGRRGAPIQ